MPHVPLKVLRGQQDEEDQYYERFQAPPGTSTEEEAERAADNDSGTSHSSDEDTTTDVGEVSEEGMARYLGRHPGAMHGANQVDDDFGEIQNDQNENAPQYDTTESVNLEAADVQVVAQMHHLPSTSRFDSVDLSNGANQADDDFGEIQNDQNENAPQYDTTGRVNLEAADVQAVAQIHRLASTDVTSNDSVDLSNDDRAPLLPNEH